MEARQAGAPVQGLRSAEAIMGLFSKRTREDLTEQHGQAWLLAGHQRFDRGKNRFFGSPETMRRGGEEALSRGDTAAAVFFFAKAIDIAQTWSRNRPHQRSYEDDAILFRLYAEAVATIRAAHPDADVLSDGVNENGRYTANMMVAVAKDCFQAGHPTEELDEAINNFLNSTGMPVPDHW
jgi:hypothetical protein